MVRQNQNNGRRRMVVVVALVVAALAAIHRDQSPPRDNTGARGESGTPGDCQRDFHQWQDRADQ